MPGTIRRFGQVMLKTLIFSVLLNKGDHGLTGNPPVVQTQKGHRLQQCKKVKNQTPTLSHALATARLFSNIWSDSFELAGYFSANAHIHLDSFSFPSLPPGYSNMFFKCIIINNVFSVIDLFCVPTLFFFFPVISLVTLYKGRIFLKPLSRVNNQEVQMSLRTLISPRVAGHWFHWGTGPNLNMDRPK